MLVVALVSLVSAAFAGTTDLAASITAPSTVPVYTSARYTFNVSNVGSNTTGTASLTIQLPVTHTTPIAVMGTVGAKTAGCTSSGSTIVCPIASLRRGRSTSVYVDLTLPESTEPIVVTSTITLSGDTNANNTASVTAALSNPSPTFTYGDVTNSHCTGTNLTSYYECSLFPSSITSFPATLNLDGSVTSTASTAIGGTWSRPTTDSLVITYTEWGTVAAEFEGYGVSDACWEGITTFPSSTVYVSPYRICR